MDTSTLTSSLVETYKELNMTYRPLGESEPAKAIITRMRDDEIRFSQALKDTITGIGTADRDYKTAGVIDDSSDSTLSHVISQFGTARATTLNLLKGIQEPSVWENPLEDGQTIRSHVEDLVRSDAVQLQRLVEAVGD